MASTRYQFSCYSDGACKGNPGPGGWGAAVIRETENVIIRMLAYGGKKKTTNIEMELTGALEVLKLCPAGHDITVYMDTQYVLKGLVNGGIDGHITKTKLGRGANFTGWVAGWMNKGWVKADGQTVAHLDIWKAVVKEVETHISKGSTLHFKWVKGHSGDEGNELADKLANLVVPS